MSNLKSLLKVPSIDIVVPSTEKSIKCRPYLMRENKVLLMTLESKPSDNEIYDTLKDLVQSCVLDWNGHSLDKLAIFDFEYIFLKIRGLSKGEHITLRFNGLEDSECELCQKTKTVKINIDDIKIKKNSEHTNNIMLNNDVGIILNYPTLQVIKKYKQYESEKKIEYIFDIIYSCLDKIYTINSGDVFDKTNIEPSEFNEFIESLTEEQFSKIEMFFVTMPKLEHFIDLTCPSCNKPDFYIVSGLENFFL